MTQITVEGNELVIRVDLDNAGQVSQSGKSNVIDSTHGFAGVATPFGMAKVSINVITSDQKWTGGGMAGKAAAQPKPQLHRPNGAPQGNGNARV